MFRCNVCGFNSATQLPVYVYHGTASIEVSGLFDACIKCAEVFVHDYLYDRCESLPKGIKVGYTDRDDALKAWYLLHDIASADSMKMLLENYYDYA